MPYVMPWSVQHPGLVVFLLDQSGSMGDRFGPDSVSHGALLMEKIALVLNVWIRRIGKACAKGTDIRPRVDLAIIGYGGRGIVNAGPQSFDFRDVISISELFANPIRVEEKVSQIYVPETGEIVQQPVEFPVWVEPAAYGGTPMCAALEKAASMSSNWVAMHREYYPPIVINITDGAATDGDPRVPAETLAAIETDDGHALLYNCHISHNPAEAQKLRYPVDIDEIEETFFAPVLFSMSSEIPQLSRKRAEARGFDGVRAGSRGFVYNGDVDDIDNIIDIATLPGFVAETTT